MGWLGIPPIKVLPRTCAPTGRNDPEVGLLHGLHKGVKSRHLLTERPVGALKVQRFQALPPLVNLRVCKREIAGGGVSKRCAPNSKNMPPIDAPNIAGCSYTSTDAHGRYAGCFRGRNGKGRKSLNSPGLKFGTTNRNRTCI
jgi:hypothetical protein